MPERGTLHRTEDGSLKLRSTVRTWALKPKHFDAALRDRLGELADGTAVEFERRRGQPARIRLIGQDLTPETRTARDPLDRRDTRFLNPYGFVPWVDRSKLPEGLRDEAPVGHQRRWPGRFSGSVTVEARAVTPLLLLDTEREQRSGNGHRVVPIDVGSDGRPRMAPTAFKGMLRSAYEAVTGSRFGIFSEDQHGTKLAYRMDAKLGLNTVPARVSEDGEHLELLCGTTPLGRQGHRGEKLHAAWIPAYGNQAQRPQVDGRPISGNDHGLRLWAVIESIHKEDGNRSFAYWRVRAFAQSEQDLPTGLAPSPQAGRHGPLAGEAMRVVSGYVLWTNRNFGRKHDERFVFSVPATERTIPLADGLRSAWHGLIKSYLAAHEGKLDNLEGGAPGGAAWSPHQYDKDRQQLAPGQLVYVLFQGDRPTGLLPVMIGRQVFDETPWEQLPESVRPALSLEQLSAADRVFGWANAAGEGAHRGQLRITDVRCTTEPADSIREFDEGVPLAILASPKPSQARFYASTRGDSGPGPLQRGAERSQLYTDRTTLSGWKRYWHHADVGSSWPEPGSPVARERYRRDTRDVQNTTVTGWVQPGCRFTVTIEVTDLHPLELGALLWLLDQPDGMHHRIGFGKPLGFGSIRTKVIEHRLSDGAAWASYWSDLEATEPPIDAAAATACVARFREEAAATLQPAWDAYEALGRGRPDVPVLYPRLVSDRDDQRGSQEELFKWFAANERRGPRSEALPPAAGDTPVLDMEI